MSRIQIGEAAPSHVPADNPDMQKSIALPPSMDSDDVALQVWLAPIRARNTGTARNYVSEVTRFRIFLAAAHPAWPRQQLLRYATEADVIMYECALGTQVSPAGTPMNLEVPVEILKYFNRSEQPFQKRSTTTAARLDEAASSRIAALDLQAFSGNAPGRLLTQSSINQALIILHGMYAFFTQPNSYCPTPYVQANPVSRLKRSKVRTVEQTQRYMPIDAIRAIYDHIVSSQNNLEAEALLNNEASVKNQLTYYKRMRWVFVLFFALWGRRAEIANLKMGDFIRDYAGWSVRLVRKGGLEETIPAPDWLIKELMLYRTDLGLPSTPVAGETNGAILRMRQARKNAPDTITHQALYLAVKKMARETAQEVEANKLLTDLPPDLRTKYVRDLLRMTPHWFRHSVASYAINEGSMSLEIASKRLAHKSTGTTSKMYYHADLKLERAGVEALGASVFAARGN